MFKRQFLQYPEGAEAGGSGNSGGSAKAAAKTPSWVPFNRETYGAETRFLVRSAKREPAEVVINQHGQLITADTRRLFGWDPEEMAPLPG